MCFDPNCYGPFLSHYERIFSPYKEIIHFFWFPIQRSLCIVGSVNLVVSQQFSIKIQRKLTNIKSIQRINVKISKTRNKSNFYTIFVMCISVDKLFSLLLLVYFVISCTIRLRTIHRKV